MLIVSQTIHEKRALCNYTNASLSEIFVFIVRDSFEFLELLDGPEPM